MSRIASASFHSMNETESWNRAVTAIRQCSRSGDRARSWSYVSVAGEM